MGAAWRINAPVRRVGAVTVEVELPLNRLDAPT